MESGASAEVGLRQQYRRRLVASGVALLTAALCAIASAVAQNRAAASLDQTLDVVRHSEALLDDILTSQGLFRLYVITRDSSTLNAQLRAAANAYQHLLAVRSLTRAEAPQQRRLDSLEVALGALALRRRATHLPAGVAEVAAYVSEPVHVALRDAVSSLSRAIIAAEDALLHQRAARARLASVALVTTLVIALLLAMLIFAGTVGAQARHDELLQASERRFRLILEQNPDGVVLIGSHGVTYANRAAAALLGVASPSSLIGIQLWTFVHEQDRQPVIERARQVLTLGELVEPRTFRFVRSDGREIRLESRATPVPINGATMALVSLRDVTQREQVDAGLRQAAKLEAVGTLAGGLAHDFNNILTVIQLGAEIMRDQATYGPPSAEDASGILAATARGRTITQQLLSFSRRNVTQPTVFEVDAVLRDSASFIGRVLLPGQHLDVERGAPDTWVRADRTEIELALMNLVANARDAMPGGGQVVLRSALAELSDADVGAHPDLAPGAYALLQVQDAGAGVSPEAREHLFEPFFTTKPPGAGTGLGLATVYGVARRAGGTVTCEIAPLEGATFSVWLPVVEGPLPVATTSTEVAVSEMPRMHHQRVLLVDDEEGVRRTVRRMLTGAGFDVLLASSGDAALELLAEHAERLDVLLTDFGMPTMTGAALIDAVHERYPHLRTILMSGYTGDEVVRQTVHGSTITFLQKPFTLEDVVRAVAGSEKRVT